MLTSTLENVLNRGLPRSPRARELCRELQGHRVGIEVTGFTRWVVESDGHTLHLTRDATSPAAAELAGGPLSLMGLLSDAPEDVLQRGQVQIRGDAELAQKFRELALLLRPDLEEELSQLIGDVPAHQLGRFARGVFGWSQKAAGTTLRNVAEYLAHEKQHLVPRAEGDQLLKGVDTLREDVDRLEARLDVVARNLAARGRAFAGNSGA
ncbi:MAG TPA: SCP2 sterol-binding domain-containing protein [Steroidobacteraceae bacterium]|nr:SCP2 sterol-binding domain-containing protein [Steroidobacteraceae bacterium]